MELSRATELAIELMTQHGLMVKGWQFSYNNRKRGLGLCNNWKKIIELSKPLTLINDEAEMRNTILHEIAHAMAGHAAGHGPVWKLMAHQIGCTGDRCASETVKQILEDAPWQAVCKGCGKIVQRFRKPKTDISCGTCCPKYFNREFQLSFQRMR